MQINEYESLELKHSEGFEIEEEYNKAWTHIRFNKIDQIEELTKQVISLFEPYVNGQFIVSENYTKLYQLFRKMRLTSMFYTSHDFMEIAITLNPKYEKIFTRKSCFRKLKYIGYSDSHMTNGIIYESKDFNGATYTIQMDDVGEERIMESRYFERIS